jgi:hypothetical protein
MSLNVTVELGYYADMLPTDRALSEDDVVRALRRVGVTQTSEAVYSLIEAGHLVRLEDGSLRRRNLAPRKEAPMTSRDENPQRAELRRAVREIVDERLRELGLIA